MAVKIPIKIDSQKTALLVIDMQNDFTEKGAILEIPDIRMGFPELKKFIGTCRSNGVAVVYTRHTYSPEGNPIEACLFPKLDDGDMRKNTHGWEINDFLKPESDDVIIDKKRYDAFYETSLEEILKKKGITDILIAGTMTEVCCDSTARSAMFRDYRVWIVSDLNFTRDENKHKYSLEIFASNFGWVVKSDEILKILDSAEVKKGEILFPRV